MKQQWILLTLVLGMLLPATTPAADEPGGRVSDLAVKGQIDGENITFTMTFEADIQTRKHQIPLVRGDVAYLDGKFPRGAEIKRSADGYVLEFAKTGQHSVSFQFASRAAKDGDWRQTAFTIPAATVRKLAVVCDRNDLEIRFPGALKAQRAVNKDQKTEVTAFLGLSDRFEVRWKPEVKRLDAELVVSAEAHTIATASVGAMRLDTIFTYRVVQGALNAITLDLPKGVNVTQVHGEDIQEWNILEAGASRELHVALSLPQEKIYMLRVEGEAILPEFPTTVLMPVITPQDVIRTSGFLMLGTDSVIKLLVTKSAGLTQVDQSAFPTGSKSTQRKLPTRNTFVYQYANMPYALEVEADDIVPEYAVQDSIVLSLRDNDLVMQAGLSLEVRDAETREIVVLTDTNWVVANVAGRQVSDYDVRDRDGKRQVSIYFKNGILGTEALHLRLERSLADQATSFASPHFSVRDAKSERGEIVVAAEKGFRLTASALEGAREIRTGSTSVSVPGAQQAFRFKSSDWSFDVNIQRTTAAIHAEIFHLLSIGEGVLYGASTITYNIGGAPTRTFKVFVPPEYSNVDFTGRDVRNFDRDLESNIWTVHLQEKVIGDYNLLVTYDRQANPEDATVDVGGVMTAGTESEVGYIAMASSASLLLEDVKLDAKALLVIDQDEIPEEYDLLINDPVLRAYKYVRSPHVARVSIKRFAAEPLLNQVIDHATLSTHISPDGETITTATYFIKNVSQQYLAVQLPEDAKLWYAKVGTENSPLQTVRPPNSDEDGVLIPLPRLRNPNTPIKVEIQYAQSHGRPGWLGETFGLRAPKTSFAHAISTRWSVKVPEDSLIARVDGNMLSDHTEAPGGLRMVVRRLVSTVSTAFSALSFIAILSGAALLLIGVCVGAFFVGRRAGFWYAAPVCVILLLLGLGLGGAGSMCAALTCFSAPQAPVESEPVVTFTKMVSLANGDGLMADVQVVPRWLGMSGSPRHLLWAGIGGILVVAAGTRRRAGSAIALGVTLLAIALAQTAGGRAALHVAVLLAVAVFALRYLWRLLRACRAAGVRSGERHARRKAAAAAVAATAAAEADAHAEAIAQAGPPAIPVTSPEATAAADANDDEPFADPEEDEVKIDETPESGPDAPREGAVRLPVLIAVALVATLGLAHASKVAPPQAVGPVMDSATYEIAGPGVGRDEERSAEVSARFVFEASSGTQIKLLEAGAVMTDMDLGSRNLSLQSSRQGYVLDVRRSGSYTVEVKYLVPVTEENGRWAMTLAIAPNMKNRVTVKIPEADIDVRSEQAVVLNIKSAKASTTASAVFGPTRTATFTWQPRVRKTQFEKAVYICEVNTLASFEPGVVDLLNLIRFQIAQGEIRTMNVEIPDGMSVTAVQANGLSTWRFDPETQILEAALESPVTGEFGLRVTTQVATEGLPYSVDIGSLSVRGAAGQRGSIAIASPETVQASVDKLEGLAAMNIADFPAQAVALLNQTSNKAKTTVKRAFRYHEGPISAKMSAKRVLPEIRVHETGTLAIRSERTVLVSDLNVDVSKAGVFSVRLKIPEGYDVETLTGQDVSHWDEIKDPDADIIVHFTKQVIGQRQLNISIASLSAKGLAERFELPRINVLGARKLDGTMVVTGEHGIRLTPVDAEREGVSDLNPRVDLGRSEPGLLAFKLLRPDWRVVLRADVQTATLKPRVLQKVEVAEGMMQGRCHVLFDIQNAGAKTFRLQAPVPGLPLSVTGADIAKVSEVDQEAGIWQIDLHNKTIKSYLLEVSYQIPFDPNARRAVILPLKVLDTDPQSGYLLVMSGGRIQVQPESAVNPGLKLDASRGISSEFGAGDLSDAILSYRAVDANYALALSVVRHKTADVLPAHVQSVGLTSVHSDHGQLLTRVNMELTVGMLRFLDMTLPSKEDRLWTVFVNGSAARPSRGADGITFRIPLDQTDANTLTTVEVTYASRSHRRWSRRSQEYKAPKFGLPLNDITWTLHVAPGMRYYDFDGDLEVVKDAPVQQLVNQIFDESVYLEKNRWQAANRREQTQSSLANAEVYAQKGEQRRAKKMLEDAMENAGNDADYEDAQIQYRNLVKQQAVVGLVQRRNSMRRAQNMQVDEAQTRQLAGFNDGNYTLEYAGRVAESLSDKDNQALMQLADRFIEQQAAAAETVEAIKIDVPPAGKSLTFTRPVQIDWTSDLAVRFKSSSPQAGRWWSELWPILLVFVVARFALARRIGSPAAA